MDHVFPRSWYPDSTPAKVQRWTAPSCGKCNRDSGTKETELFVRMAFCVDPRKPGADGLAKQALRAVG
jgi:hypothetical protein